MPIIPSYSIYIAQSKHFTAELNTLIKTTRTANQATEIRKNCWLRQWPLTCCLLNPERSQTIVPHLLKGP